jgi:HlyD family secretion protein
VLVAAGQVVARIDVSEIEAQRREAEARVRQAEHGLLEARALLAQRKAELTFAGQELARAETLEERGFAPGEAVDLRRSQRATAEAAVASAEAAVARAAMPAKPAGNLRLRKLHLHQAAQAATLLERKLAVILSHGDPGHSGCRTCNWNPGSSTAVLFKDSLCY